MALTHSQYHTLLRSYEQKQLHTRDILESRKRELYAKVPEVKAIEDLISELSVSHARKLLDGDCTALTSLKEETQRLIAQKERLIADAGFPADYLEPIYECKDCKDTGYVDNQKCHCFRKAEIALLYTQSNLQNILKEENFDTFSLKYYSKNHIDPKTGCSSLENIEKALLTCREFVDTFGTDFRNLFLYGDTGVGKTFLSHCIAKELIDKAYSVIYFTTFDLFDIITNGRFGKDQVAEEMYEHIFDCDLLIIDDLGAEKASTFTASQLFLCLNERLLHKKPTIISSNLSLDAVKQIYSERTFSRITSNYTMLKLTGDDIRIKKKLMN